MTGYRLHLGPTAIGILLSASPSPVEQIDGVNPDHTCGWTLQKIREGLFDRTPRLLAVAFASMYEVEPPINIRRRQPSIT